MRNRKVFLKWIQRVCMIWMFFLFWGIREDGYLTVNAGTFAAADMAQYPGVTVSPNGMAWTIDYMNRDGERLPEGYTVFTGASQRLEDLQPGEHYYRGPVNGGLSISKWSVSWPNAQCIHGGGEKDYMGYHVEAGNCKKFYNNGWHAYCADCGEVVTEYIMYGRSQTVQKITSMPAQSVYLHICPYCRGLEQGIEYKHVCKLISANHYSIRYEKNTPTGATVTGYMQDTHHMYDNAAEYEGLSAEEAGFDDRRLRNNGYQCVGYVFLGWNTRPDGSGQSFRDGQAVLNLGEDNNQTVPLYAQWRKCSSTLVIDAAGGTYQGQSVFRREDVSGKAYNLSTGRLVPANGYQVTFQTNGGSAVSTLTTQKKFSHWEAVPTLYGSLKESIYEYGNTDGTQDTVRACYVNQSFTLPDSVKSNTSLAGWYSTPDFKEESFLGRPGEQAWVDQNTVVYAKWVQLTLWAYDDYVSHSGSGAVDLKWEQKDGKGKFYKIFQSADKSKWQELSMLQGSSTSESIKKNFSSANQGERFTVPAGGYYTLTAAGAKGGDYSESLPGGAGGRVTATYWLQKGDVITAYAGSTGTNPAGGASKAGAAGGAASDAAGRGGGAGTELYLTRQGVKHLLLVAGGGGGASEKSKGGPGGGSITGVGNMQGASGAYGGGGGGATGGTGGIFLAHYHVGSPDSGGGCYVAESGTKVCGTAYEAVGKYWECKCGATWGIHSDHYFRQEHAACGEYYLKGGTYKCSGCGIGLSAGETHRISYTSYVLGCAYKDQQDGYIISAEAALGGSSYINTAFGCKDQLWKAGENAAAGYASLSGNDVGYREDTTLADVAAKDKAAPGLVTEYQLTLASENQIKVTFTKPADYGTKYYHQAKSFANDGSLKQIAESNITINTLTSGVKGYYYRIDNQPNTVVGTSGSWLTGQQLLVAPSAGNYLHLAAADRAGNVGSTAHIPLNVGIQELPTDDEYPKQGQLFTKQMTLNPSDFIYSVDGKQYYVKADGITNHVMIAEGYMNQSATKAYQIDSIRFYAEQNGAEEWLQITTPHGALHLSTEDFGNSSLTLDIGNNSFQSFVPVRSVSERAGYGTVLKTEQTFSVAPQASAFYVYPQARASLGDSTYCSEKNADFSHGLTIIPDGAAPVIEGLKALQEFDILDMTAQQKIFSLHAYDTGSGLKEFIVTVKNLDNFTERFFTADNQGNITLQVDKEDPLFNGELEILAMATDRVGNVNENGGEGMAFTLTASILREREPEITVFKKGDGGVLYITTTGYADKVEVTFPEAFLKLNPDLNQTYDYPYPFLEKTETIHFHVPLEAAEQAYEITVKAWKNDRLLTDCPNLLVVEGTVLDEIRTRIRNNR